MQMPATFRTALAVGALVLWASPAHAQIYEIVGTRAQGMGGAFVAVADDATATWWNPAGLATGAYFSGVLERGSATEPAEHRPNGPAWQGDTEAFALVFPALGLSYYRLRINEIAPSASIEGSAPDRQHQGASGVSLRALATRQFGVTIGQSVGSHLVLASTFRLVRGGLGLASGAAVEDPLDAAADLSVPADTEGDLDLGAMASFGSARLALVVKHVREPAFGDGENRFVLERQVRTGLAFEAQPAGAVNALTFALDADLSKTPTAFGEARHVAAGAEVWVLGRRVGVRGGVSTNTVGEASTSTSAGASLAARSGLYLDGAVTVGSDKSREGWTIGLRVTF